MFYSTEGYTSISVREPLANILAQQPPGKPSNRNPTLSRDVNDSHYATVSDDSGESQEKHHFSPGQFQCYTYLEFNNIQNLIHIFSNTFS